MENQTTIMQNVFSQSTFDRMCDNARLCYEATIEKPHLLGVRGAVVEFMVDGCQAAADKYHQLLSSGWTPLIGAPFESFSLVGTAGGIALIQIFVVKPAEQQAAELNEIFANMKVQYLKDLEEAQAQEIERQIDIALAAAARAEETKMLAAQQAIAEKVRFSMQASRDKLRAQLIQKGKLNQDGEAA